MLKQLPYPGCQQQNGQGLTLAQADDDPNPEMFTGCKHIGVRHEWEGYQFAGDELQDDNSGGYAYQKARGWRKDEAVRFHGFRGGTDRF